ncbi:MAG: alpha/beta hydrolase [Spirosomataceae bacterium]
MSEITKTLTAKDRLSLFSRAWRVENPKGAIALIHGFGEHSGRYAHVAQFFNTYGYAVYALDNRGHGQSDGKRGHTPRYESYLDDIGVFLAEVNSQIGDKPLFLYGHSMGGNLALNYVLKRKPSLKGLIATGPWVQLAFEPKPILVFLGKLMRYIFPSFSQDSDLEQSHISKDATVVEAYKNDPLVHGKITASASIGVLEAASFLNEYTGTMPIPTLIMHGSDDLLTSQPASEVFSKRVGGDIVYKKWEGMYHELHNEPQKQAVFQYTLEWLEKNS